MQRKQKLFQLIYYCYVIAEQIQNVPRVEGMVENQLKQLRVEMQSQINKEQKSYPKFPPQFLPKYYAFVCEEEPRSYSDDINYEIEYGEANNYEFLGQIGSGTFGDTYKGKIKQTGQYVAIKILNENSYWKIINREIMSLKILKGHRNINQIIDVIKNPDDGNTAIVMEFVDTHSKGTSQIMKKVDDITLRKYMFQILLALDYANFKGIIHRDLKNNNILIDQTTGLLRIIDWGSSDFYHPGKNDYWKIVSYFYYRAPETLAGMQNYTYAYDMWSLGCVFAATLFRKDYMFTGSDDLHQLNAITRILGSEKFYQFLERYQWKLDDELEKTLSRFQKKPWSDFIDDNNKDIAHSVALDLLDMLLIYDPQKRITPRDAIQHPYFDPIRNLEEFKTLNNPLKSVPTEDLSKYYLQKEVEQFEEQYNEKFENSASYYIDEHSESFNSQEQKQSEFAWQEVPNSSLNTFYKSKTD